LLTSIHKKVQELNDLILPKGCNKSLSRTHNKERWTGKSQESYFEVAGALDVERPNTRRASNSENRFRLMLPSVLAGALLLVEAAGIPPGIRSKTVPKLYQVKGALDLLKFL